MPEQRFVLDADMPRSAAEVFRRHGLDIEDVRDIGLGGARDREIMEHALSRDRVVVTRDTDFGEVLRYPKHPGAIILRLPHTFTSRQICDQLDRFLATASRDSLRGAVTIVELGRYRRRPIE